MSSAPFLSADVPFLKAFRREESGSCPDRHCGAAEAKLDTEEEQNGNNQAKYASKRK